MGADMNEQRKRELLMVLLDELSREPDMLRVDLQQEARRLMDKSASVQELWLSFRSLVNVRLPRPTTPAFLQAQDELLRGLIKEAGVHNCTDAQQSTVDARLYLWQGDITTLAVDAIVNAANAEMTGCWAPLHYCIDNAIHTFAGVQLRARCAELMKEQGHPEPTAQAKVTDAYNLPSRFVIHTVGPIADGRPSDTHRAELAQCYRACLDAAGEAGAHSIAFCCISTGVFGFPQEEAATIAVRTVRAWLDEHPDVSMDVVFNVFGDADRVLYERLLMA